MSERPPVIDLSSADHWRQDGTFPDSDGAQVRAYDDVVLLKAALPENKGDAAHVIPVGTTATVLFHGGDAETPLQLEACWPENSFCIAYALPRDVKLHMTNEEKYPR